MMKMTLTLLGMVLSLQVQAGGWTSGGGELIRDGRNPWYLQNTKDVSYCIIVDQNKIGQSVEFVRSKVVKAFDFWKRQLSDLSFSSYGGGKFAVGTQTFYEVSCQSKPDITFQFGYLTQEQAQRLGDISSMAALTIRTDYDSVNLRGKGFVYFQPNDKLPNKPWTRSEGSRIFPILIHEMGHIFGIQHNESIQFMDETFAETLIDHDSPWIDQSMIWLDTGNNYQDISLFKYRNAQLVVLGSCGTSVVMPIPGTRFKAKNIDNVKNKFFGFPTEHNCDSVYFAGEKLVVKSGKDKSELFGEAKLVNDSMNFGGLIARSVKVIELWAPKEQTVFPGMYQYRFQVASFIPTQIYRGVYKSLDGKTSREVTVEVDNSGYLKNVSGYMDGKVFLNIEMGY